MKVPVAGRRWSLPTRVTALATAVVGVLVIVVAVLMYAAAPGAHFHAARDIGLFLLGFLLALGVVASCVWTYVRRALRPVRKLTRELSMISEERSSHRVTVPESNDDVARLAEEVNGTLRRLERANDRLSAWVADASHELRSPLTGLRTQLEVALQHPDDEDWPQVAQAALLDADRLQRITGDLLEMAKLEAGVLGEREPVDLGELVRAETERRSGRVPVELDTDEGVIVSGARSHLVRLLTNLLDNADRHAKSWVRVAVGSEEGNALLMVADDGPGIPPEERERVFQRFQRLAEADRCSPGGTGLGLPISRDIARAHGGSLTVGDAGGEGGARLILRLPLA